MATMILKDTYVMLEKEIKSMAKLRTEISVQIREAAAHGDLKENYDYKAAKEAMNLLVNKKEFLDSHTPFRFIEFGNIDIDEVSFGNKVTIQEEGKNDPEDYYLLGPIEFEFDLYPLIVTYHSPFGQNMIGKKVGDYFTLDIQDKETRFTIIAIKKVSLDDKNSD